MKSQQFLSWLLLLGILIILLSLPVKGKPYSERDDDTNGLLDTFSLSFAGNLNFANALEGIGKILEGISNFIDLEIVSAAVELVLDRFLPIRNGVNDQTSPMNNDIEGPKSRMDIDVGDTDATPFWLKKHDLKERITTVVGAVLHKQKCWERTACEMGKAAQDFSAKDILFIMAEKIVPTWNETLALVKGASYNVIKCEDFTCAPDQKFE